MRSRVQTMVGLAAVAIFGCSSPAEEHLGAAGTGGGAAGTGAAGTTGVAGTWGGGGTSGVAGASGIEGTGGAGKSGAAGEGAAGMPGTGGTSAAGMTGTGGCPVGVKGHCNADTGARDKYAGYTLALAEEFDAPLDLDSDPIWTWSDGGPPEGQARFVKDAITFSGGLMHITATAKNIPSSTSFAEPGKNQQTGTAHACTVQSGELRTKYNNYRYGRYEVRFKAPVENAGKNGDGNYLSTMFVFRTPKWSEWNEIDIELEANIKGKVAYNMVNALNQTSFPGGDAGSMVPQGTTGFDITSAFHTYAFEWTPTKVTWYVDGAKLRDNGATPPIPTNSAKIMMNLWVFASNAAFGEPANNTYPFHAEYDWFRFYKWTNEVMYPVDSPKTQLPAGDVDYSKNNPSETVYP